MLLSPVRRFVCYFSDSYFRCIQIVKLKSDDAESPVVTKSVDPVATKKPLASSNRPHTSGAPNKPAGIRVAGAGARSSAGVKEGERRPKPVAAGHLSPEGGASHRKSSAPGAIESNTNSTSGANASGVWAREVLPSLSKK